MLTQLLFLLDTATEVTIQSIAPAFGSFVTCVIIIDRQLRDIGSCRQNNNNNNDSDNNDNDNNNGHLARLT